MPSRASLTAPVCTVGCRTQQRAILPRAEASKHSEIRIRGQELPRTAEQVVNIGLEQIAEEEERHSNILGP